MKRILTVGLTTAVLAVLALVGGGGVAAADTPRCVTRAEFYAAEIGMSKGRVHRIFDTDGQLADRMGDGMNRAYKMCSTGREASTPNTPCAGAFGA